MTLRRAVGRFVTARGAMQALHFMPLKSFHLDVAYDAAVIVALRTARTTGDRTLLETLGIRDWLYRLQANELASLVADMVSGPVRLLEIGPAAGVLFEAVKLKGRSVVLTHYTGVGPAGERARFEMLHGDGTVPFTYTDRIELEDLDEDGGDPVLTVFNQNQAVRFGHGGDLDWAGAIAVARLPTLAALRVSLGRSATRMTVHGHRVVLPGLNDLRRRLRETARPWQVAVKPGFDAGLFLPDPDAPGDAPDTALCILLCRADADRQDGFEPV